MTVYVSIQTFEQQKRDGATFQFKHSNHSNVTVQHFNSNSRTTKCHRTILQLKHSNHKNATEHFNSNIRTTKVSQNNIQFKHSTPPPQYVTEHLNSNIQTPKMSQNNISIQTVKPPKFHRTISQFKHSNDKKCVRTTSQPQNDDAQ